MKCESSIKCCAQNGSFYIRNAVLDCSSHSAVIWKQKNRTGGVFYLWIYAGIPENLSGRFVQHDNANWYARLKHNNS